MEQAAAPHVLELTLGEAHRGGELDRQIGHALGVAARVEVLGFERLRQAEQNRLAGVEVVVEKLHVQQ